MSSTKSGSQLLRVDYRQRVRVSSERREAILDEFERSGLSGAAFAKLHGIKYSTFAGWSLKRRKQAANSPPTTTRPVPSIGFTEVIVTQDAKAGPTWPSAGSLVVHLPGGAWLQLDGAPSQAQLAAQLLKDLQA